MEKGRQTVGFDLFNPHTSRINNRNVEKIQVKGKNHCCECEAKVALEFSLSEAAPYFVRITATARRV